ncbi:transposase [Anabaenopsis elenkinii]|uniref:Transposase n=1 Tax=Anabaenopsis elenkinii CCIBt3563 TaxID=2779889 RepID=A0A7S6U2F5_9CYAN|nr:transposase [Anabaenopsis elenkinii]QOV22915.1 transposase [Anabaenopsis elenkinii CCIBt3563]
MQKFKSNNNVVYSCKYHVIFCPKYRRPVLVNAIASRLKELLAQMLKRRLPTLWTNSYFVSTVGGAPLETVKMYIQNQKET